MSDPIDLRTDPRALSEIPEGSLVTGVKTNATDPNSATDTKWKVIGPGMLKKVRD